MGMAASQARYIELTARKTDVEYQGQQINQQRMSLANESAGMFTQLMNLVVPTPPSTSDYTTTSYTFSDGDQTYTIDNMKPLTGDPNYNYNVTYHYTDSVYTGVGQTRSDLGVNKIVTTTSTTPVTTSTVYWLTNGTTGANQVQLTQCSAGTTTTTDTTAITQIIQDTGSSTNFAQDYANSGLGGIYRYTDTSGVTHYYGITDLTNAYNSGGGYAVALTGYYATDLNQNTSLTSKAYVQSSNTGRYSSIQLQNSTGTYNLNATTTTNENAYNDAMNEYQYQQELYNQQVNNINAKTEVIERQDRTLEMELKQLDTEQQALQTEMEAVKKVIDKNIEETFKTFGSN